MHAMVENQTKAWPVATGCAADDQQKQAEQTIVSALWRANATGFRDIVWLKPVEYYGGYQGRQPRKTGKRLNPSS